MKRALAAAAAAAFAAGLSGCASAPPPPPPAPETVPAETPEKPADTTSAGAVYLVAAKTANLRKSPATSSATLGRLKKGDRITSLEEKNGWLRVKAANEQIGWVRRDLVRKDDGCMADRRELLLLPPMLHMSEAGAPGARGKVVVEADIDDKGDVKAVRVVKNETGSPERAELAKSEVLGVKFQPPVRKCRATGFTYVYTRTF
jgi:outer membrane biosynthesis protein TonB